MTELRLHGRVTQLGIGLLLCTSFLSGDCGRINYEVEAAHDAEADTVMGCTVDADCPGSPPAVCFYRPSPPGRCTVACRPIPDGGCPSGQTCHIYAWLARDLAYTDCRMVGTLPLYSVCTGDFDCGLPQCIGRNASVLAVLSRVHVRLFRRPLLYHRHSVPDDWWRALRCLHLIAALESSPDRDQRSARNERAADRSRRLATPGDHGAEGP